MTSPCVPAWPMFSGTMKGWLGSSDLSVRTKRTGGLEGEVQELVPDACSRGKLAWTSKLRSLPLPPDGVTSQRNHCQANWQNWQKSVPPPGISCGGLGLA